MDPASLQQLIHSEGDRYRQDQTQDHGNPDVGNIPVDDLGANDQRIFMHDEYLHGIAADPLQHTVLL